VRIAACALLAFVAGGAHATEVYYSTDAKGNVIYSDRPENATSKYVHVNELRPPAGAARSSAAAAAQTQSKAAAGGPETTADGAPKKEKREPTPEEKAEDRAKNCKTAQQRQQSYDQSHRLYRVGPNGERQYLTDAEIDEARARAKADVETWCD
jgi:catalase